MTADRPPSTDGAAWAAAMIDGHRIARSLANPPRLPNIHESFTLQNFALLLIANAADKDAATAGVMRALHRLGVL